MWASISPTGVLPGQSGIYYVREKFLARSARILMVIGGRPRVAFADFRGLSVVLVKRRPPDRRSAVWPRQHALLAPGDGVGAACRCMNIQEGDRGCVDSAEGRGRWAVGREADGERAGLGSAVLTGSPPRMRSMR